MTQMQGMRRSGGCQKRWVDNIDQGSHEIIPEDISDNRSVWPKIVKADTLLHGGGLTIGEMVRKILNTFNHASKVHDNIMIFAEIETQTGFRKERITIFRTFYQHLFLVLNICNVH